MYVKGPRGRLRVRKRPLGAIYTNVDCRLGSNLPSETGARYRSVERVGLLHPRVISVGMSNEWESTD